MSNLEWHTYPVLSLALLALTKDSVSQGLSDSDSSLSPMLLDRQSGCLLVSGATDGGLALWHLQQRSPAASPALAAGRLESQRLLCLPGLHQSGVNAASIAVPPHTEGEILWICHQDRLDMSQAATAD